jgi:transposase-like protein
MAKTRKSYQKRSPDQWRQLVADQRSSGQSVRRFAQSRGVCESSMGRWSRLLHSEGESDLDKARPARSGSESRGGGLVELVTQHQRSDVGPRSDEVRLLVGSGVCLELSRLPAPEYLALVAHAYEAVLS